MTLVLALAVLISPVVAWFLIAGDGTQGSPEYGIGAELNPLLTNLGPNTTLHMREIIYVRHGPDESDIPREDYLPETYIDEQWITFDTAGVVTDAKGELRSLDGRVVRSSELASGDLVVWNADGSERLADRRPGLFEGKTVDDLKSVLLNALVENERTIIRESGSRAELDGKPVLVVDVERKFFRPNGNEDERGSSKGYTLPYIADLGSDVELRRSYILPDDFRTVRTERVIVESDGTETVVESHEWVAFEVVPRD